MKRGTTNEKVKIGTVKLLKRVGLSMDDIDFFVTDNGSNMMACFKTESKRKIHFCVLNIYLFYRFICDNEQ